MTCVGLVAAALRTSAEGEGYEYDPTVGLHEEEGVEEG